MLLTWTTWTIFIKIPLTIAIKKYCVLKLSLKPNCIFDCILSGRSYNWNHIFGRMNIIQRLLIESVIYLLVYKVELGDFHVWYHQESSFFGRKSKNHFAVANSSFANLFDNYSNVSIVFVASKKIWISKIDERDISTSFKNICTSMWVNCRSTDVFLSFIII